MTTAPEQIDGTPSPTDLQQFVHLVSNLSELLQIAKREVERDHEAAKASLTAFGYVPTSPRPKKRA
jgi:uncharacterized membrane protein